MSTELDKLKRQVEVLRAAILGPTAADFGTRFAAVEAADRIAAEPVEATDWEVVMGWQMGDGFAARCTHTNYVEGGCDLFLDSKLFRAATFESAYAQAAAWVRSQGGES